jgi:glycosyltransferase involved in cell wall biosynthesis
MHTEIVAPGHVNEYIARQDSNSALTFRLRHPQRGLKYRPMLMAPLFRLAAQWQRPDIIHETHYLLQGGHLPRGVPLMATCHDMILERHADDSPGSIDAICRKREAFERASGIICISEHTRSDLLHHYPHLEPRVSVVHHGVDRIEAPASVTNPLPEYYILFVGVRSGYKNFANAVWAMGASALVRQNYHLVCFGGGPLSAAERQLLADASLPANRVIQCSGDERLLAYAYKHAAALIYPSTYEGFGMPLTEAMMQGCPVLCSGASCFPEICADAAQYFDPTSVESIRQAMEELLDDTARRATLVRLGYQRVAKFTWQACAAGTAVAYGTALARGAVH